MLIVALEHDACRSESYHSSEETEFLVILSATSRDLNLKFIFLGEMVAEPLELVVFSRQEEVVDMDDYPQITLGVTENTIGNLTLFKPHLLHVTLDYREPCEWGITGPV